MSTLRKGFNSSTGMANSSRNKSTSPGTRAVPPATTIRWMFSPLAVALKKSNVFWISRVKMSDTLRKICCLCSSVTLGSVSPFFRRSASSKLRSSSFCSASVYWFPPTLTSRVNSGIPPRTMLMFITLAPMFSSATVCALAGFRGNPVVQLLLGHQRQRHTLNDDRVPRYRSCHIPDLDAFGIKYLADGVGDLGRVHDRPVHHRVWRQGLHSEAYEFVARLGGFQLHRFDGAGSNVQAYDLLALFSA